MENITHEHIEKQVHEWVDKNLLLFLESQEVKLLFMDF